MNDPTKDDRLSRLERDVLLASSGELPWTRRLTLRRRLRSAPEARRLQRDLAALSDVTAGERSAPRARSLARWTVSLVAAAAVMVLAVWIHRHTPRTAGEPSGGELVRAPRPATEPVSVAAARLLIASTRLDRVPTPTGSSHELASRSGRATDRWWTRVPSAPSLSLSSATPALAPETSTPGGEPR